MPQTYAARFMYNTVECLTLNTKRLFMHKTRIGFLGEDIACSFLKDKGMKILYRNLRWPWGELDIVARANDGTLIIVEVKTFWSSDEEAMPERNYDYNKARKTMKTVQLFIQNNQYLINDERGFRLDLIAVQIVHQELIDWKKDCRIRHYENV